MKQKLKERMKSERKPTLQLNSRIILMFRYHSIETEHLLYIHLTPMSCYLHVQIFCRVPFRSESKLTAHQTLFRMRMSR